MSASPNLRQALARLLACIDDHKGHGVPTIRDRAECYMAMREAEKAVADQGAELVPPTEKEIATYRDTFRSELDRRMDTRHPSASPSTESHGVALRQFVANRNAGKSQA